MKEFLVYTAGPITGLTYNDILGWREYVNEMVPEWISCISPLRGKHVLKDNPDKIAKDVHPDAILSTGIAINQRDFNDIKRCDLVLVNLLGTTKVSIGTVMEIAWARAFGKPVVLLLESGNIHDHTLLKFPAGYITTDLDEAIDVVVSVLGTDKQIELYQNS